MVCAAMCVLLLASAASSFPASAAADSQKRAAQLTELQMLDQRVANIGWKLATQNLELCPAHFAATGIVLHTESQYDQNWRSAAIDAFGFRPGKPGVLAVAQGSPAWSAGLKPNDVILSLNGASFNESDSNRRISKGDYSETDKLMAQIENASLVRPIELVVERGEEHFSLSIMPVTSCASRFEMVTSNDLNANSNGSVVQVFGRLVIALPRDDDLALVIGHELAHNALGHNQAIKSRHLATGLAAAFTGSGKVLRDFELQADRYGIFMVARAGYAYQHAAQFWKQFASSGGVGAWIPVTHPSPRSRQRKAQSAVDEIDGLIARHKPLIPGQPLT